MKILQFYNFGIPNYNEFYDMHMLFFKNTFKIMFNDASNLENLTVGSSVNMSLKWPLINLLIVPSSIITAGFMGHTKT